MKVGCIINSLLSGSGDLPSYLSESENLPWIFQFYYTKYAGHARKLATEAINEGCTYIIAVGGDGTLNEVINGVYGAGMSQHCIIGLLPLGTGNDFSRSIAVPRTSKELIRCLLDNKTQWLDVGKVTEKASGKSRVFINVADAGIGGKVTQNLHTSNNNLGRWVYLKALVKALFQYRSPEVKLEFETEKWEGKLLTVVVGNGSSFGGGLKVAYQANPSDGTFFIAVVSPATIIDLMRFLPQIIQGKKVKSKKIAYYSSTSLTITPGKDEECLLEMDGEIGFSAPVQVECFPKAIKFLKIEP